MMEFLNWLPSPVGSASGGLLDEVFDLQPEVQLPEAGPVEDDYDPRKPEFITPASEEQIEQCNSRLIQEQIAKLENALARRPHVVPQVAEHYSSVLDEMRHAPKLSGFQLNRSRSAPVEALHSLCHSPMSRRPRHATALGDCVVWEDSAGDLDTERFDIDKVEAMNHCGPLKPGEMFSAFVKTSPVGSEVETCAPLSSGSRGSRSNFSDFEPDLERAPSVNLSTCPRPGSMMCRSPKPACNDGEVHPASLMPPSSLNSGIAEEKQPLLSSHPDARWAAGPAGSPRTWARHRSRPDEGVCGLLGHVCPGASWEDSMRRLRDHHEEFGAAFVHWAMPGFNGLQQVQQGMITFGKPL